MPTEGDGTTHLARPESRQTPYSQTATPAPEPEGFPLALRGLTAFLVLDALVGIWLALNAPEALASYVSAQVPAIGIGGLMWGFLPDDPKKAFGRWLQRQLARKALFMSLLIAAGATMLVSLFVGSIVVRSVDPNAATQLYFVRGTRDAPDSARVMNARPERLNRLTTPVRRYTIVSPFGSRTWVFTPTHVIAENRKIRPWIPASVQYPDDFQEMITIAVLPDPRIIFKLKNASAVLKLTDAQPPYDLIAHGPLADHGVFVAYRSPGQPDALTVDRWRQWLVDSARDTSSAALDVMLASWKARDVVPSQRWIRAAKPLSSGQEIVWEVLSKSGTRLAGDTLTLDSRVSDLPVRY